MALLVVLCFLRSVPTLSFPFLSFTLTGAEDKDEDDEVQEVSKKAPLFDSCKTRADLPSLRS